MTTIILDQKFFTAIDTTALDEYNDGVDETIQLTTDQAAEKLAECYEEFMSDLEDSIADAFDSRKQQAKERFLDAQWVYNDYLSNYGLNEFVTNEEFYNLLPESLFLQQSR
jgi:GH35 family endo-1,4-beta-xylanase